MFVSQGMPKKSYKQHCGVARALDVVGERWTLLMTRNLLLGPKRYSDLLAELPGITTNLLAKRLHELEQAELVHKELLPLGVTVYRLTEAGRALEPVVMELGRWGGRFMTTPGRGDTFNLGWALLSLKRRYRGGLSCTVQLCAGRRRFCLEFSERYLDVQERTADRADLTVTADEAAVRALFFEAAPWAPLEDSGRVVFDGARGTVRALERALPNLPNASVQRRATTRRKLSSKNISVSSKRDV